MLTVKKLSLPAMSEQSVALVRKIEERALQYEQIMPRTEHLFHHGMYARTMSLPAGAQMTSTLMKVATILVVNGDVLVYDGSEIPLHLVGHHVIPAEIGRKSLFMAQTETYFTMFYATSATTVDAVEREITDEFEKLLSRKAL